MKAIPVLKEPVEEDDDADYEKSSQKAHDL
jgi:hypothetical protein